MTDEEYLDHRRPGVLFDARLAADRPYANATARRRKEFIPSIGDARFIPLQMSSPGVHGAQTT